MYTTQGFLAKYSLTFFLSILLPYLDFIGFGSNQTVVARRSERNIFFGFFENAACYGYLPDEHLKNISERSRQPRISSQLISKAEAENY